MTIIIAGSWVYILNMVIATPWGNQINVAIFVSLKIQTVRCLLVVVVVVVVFDILFSCFPDVVAAAVAAAVLTAVAVSN